MSSQATGIRRVRASRYVAPLREGGSLPGLMEADDDGLYVVKFRGAGQGGLALVAEIFLGELARSLGLPVPEIVLIDVDADLAAAEGDPEIQELIRASDGLNLGMDFLPGAFGFAPPVLRDLAARIVWFDGLCMNVDRTAKNPNLLRWHNQIWMIDHGAAMPAQHGDAPLEEASVRAFERIAQHVLLNFAGSILDAHQEMSARLTEPVVRTAASFIPAEWTGRHAPEDYAAFILRRNREASFAQEAEDAKS